MGYNDLLVIPAGATNIRVAEVPIDRILHQIPFSADNSCQDFQSNPAKIRSRMKSLVAEKERYRTSEELGRKYFEFERKLNGKCWQLNFSGCS
jgi:hypothetical protein